MDKGQKPILYIAGPYSGGDVVMNVRTAIQMADVARRRGWLPFCPHLFHLWHIVEPHQWAYWTEMDMEWLELADALYRIRGESPGADAEVERAKERGIPVYTEFMPSGRYFYRQGKV